MDIHNYKRRLETTLKQVENSEISKKNQNNILEFHNFCFSEGIGMAKIQRYIYDLKKLAEMLKKDFTSCKKEDIQNLMALLEKTSYSHNTKRGFRVALKKFFKWLKKIDDKGVYPEEVRWISTTGRENHHRLPEDLLIEEEVVEMIKNTESLRDRAFIACLYESGCRVSELLTIKVKNISFDEYGAKITVFGKTGSRRVRLISSSPYIQAWLNKHQKADDPESPVWIGEYKGKIVSYTRIREILSNIAKKAGIKKRVNPHSFRHARATFLSNHLTESQLKEVFGWTQASKMAAIYVHLSGRDTDEALLKVNGIKINKETEEQKFKSQKCPRCNTNNESTNKFCKLCGFILDNQMKQEIIKKETEKQGMELLMENLLKDQEIMELIKRKLVQ